MTVAILLLTQNVWARPTASPAMAPGPSATTVNYQGRLADNGGTPLDGTYGMSFSLWDAATDGSLVWGPESHAAVPVSEGLFSVGLGSQTSGGIPTSVWDGDRYLEITVGGETLSPRELIRSVPIAGMALTVPDGAIDRSKFDSMTGIVWKTPPFWEYENIVWAYNENPVWDISDLLEEAGVPSDAEMILLGWRPSVIVRAASFRFLDSNDNQLGGINLSTVDRSSNWSPASPEMGTPIPVPGDTRKIEITWIDAYNAPDHPRRTLIVYGWK